jgi:hypothetical protein
MINKYNQLSEQQSEFIKSAITLTRSLYDLLIKWQELETKDEILACEDYPFNESLDEVWARVSNWNEDLIERFQKSNKFSPTITVKDLKNILENLSDDVQVVVATENEGGWWLNIEEVEMPDNDGMFTLTFHTKNNFDPRQF